MNGKRSRFSKPREQGTKGAPIVAGIGWVPKPLAMIAIPENRMPVPGHCSSRGRSNTQ